MSDPQMDEAPRAATRVEVRDARERAIATLTEAFSRDDLEMDELEGRLSKVHNADTLEAINALVADLKPAVAPVSTALAKPAPSPLAHSEERPAQAIMAFMGGAERRGAWAVPREMRAVSVMGGTLLDFREAQLPAGVVELTVYALMGGVEIIVPPELAVETNGSGIMGGFAHLARAPVDNNPERTVLRISGIAMMGGVDVQTRLPGESGREARRREKKSRRALRSGG